MLYLIIGLVALAAEWWAHRATLTPDGLTYLRARAVGEGRIAIGGWEPCQPFRLRWLLPWLWRQTRDPMLAGRYSCYVGCVLSAALVGHLGGWRAELLFLALPLWSCWVRHPWQIDAPAMALALLAATSDTWWVVVLISLVAGAAKESAPLFAAVYAWSPLPLVGLLVPLVSDMLLPAGEPRDAAEGAIVGRPWASARVYHGPALHDVSMVAPWGAVLLAGACPTWQLGAALALGYGQLLVAVDRARLYLWAAPVACTLASDILEQLPLGFTAGAVLITYFQPVRKCMANE